MIAIIVAQAQNRVIGYRGDLPWRGQLPADMAHFQELTMGHSVVMGRATYESIPKKFRALEGREPVVLTRDPHYVAECPVMSTLNAGLALAATLAPGPVFVIGGASVYIAALPLADVVFMTLIDAKFPGDTFFPPLPESEWDMNRPQWFEPDGHNRFSYCFVTYDRIADAP